MRIKIKQFLISALFIASLVVPFHNTEKAVAESTESNRFWEYQCIDTMKFSRDAAREFLSNRDRANQFISDEITLIKSLGANCVAIATPYDEEFIPILQQWVETAHNHNLNVWFRGNFSAWENWFDYPKFTNEQQHLAATRNFLLKHSNLLLARDIFTPAPEAENGIIGNPWDSEARKTRLRKFVIDSFNTCEQALEEAGKQDVQCGYFSANGDVAEKIYTPETIAKTGGVVVMDHYVSTVERMSNDIQRVAHNQNAQIALGEFGAPIPDINGEMTEQQQADFVKNLLNVFYAQKDKIKLINYWVLRGGSTSLINPDGSRRLAAEVVADYYSPGRLQGEVTNTLGQPLKNVKIETADGLHKTETDENGNFELILPAGNIMLTLNVSDYKEKIETAKIMRLSDTDSKIELDPTDPSWWYKVRLKLVNLF